MYMFYFAGDFRVGKHLSSLFSVDMPTLQIHGKVSAMKIFETL